MQFLHFISNHIVLLLVVFTLLFAGCASVVISTNEIKDKSLLQSDMKKINFNPMQTAIAKPFLPFLSNSDGAMLVSDGEDALFHRAYLARMAQKRIIVQTYIYKNDLASRFLMHELWLAAQRGVKIQMLIDDNGLDSDYSDIIMLDSHDNIEVKIFNPYKHRSKILRYPEMIFDFNRINHRMHNKLFIADDIALIVGGRNIANNYFDSHDEVNFIDTEVLFLGKVALNAVENFKLYWDFHRSVPVSLLPKKPSKKKLLIATKEIESNPNYKQYDNEIKKRITLFNSHKLAFYWGRAHFIADNPQKIENKLQAKPISQALQEILDATKNNLYISAAYLVPGKQGLKRFLSLKQNGIDINILTNSLASTDSLVVYGAWERYRDELVKIGVKVYEYQYLGSGKSKLKGKMAKSKASLHSKSMVFDDRITWVGSFNLDERSNNLNTEVVVIFDNVEFAKLLKNELQEDISNAWEIKLENNKTIWEGEHNGEKQKHKKSPDTGLFTRILNIFSKVLPEDQI